MSGIHQVYTMIINFLGFPDAPACPSGILYPWYKVVQGGMYWYEPVRTLVDTRPYKKPQIGTRQYVLTSVIPRSVRTGMYWHVLTCTIWYKVVQGGTRWYKAV